MSSDKRSRGADAPPRHVKAADIVDRVLDRGMVIDYHSRVSVGGIDALVTIDGQSVVTSTQTNLEYAAPVRTPARITNARPWFDGPADPFVDAPVALEKGPRRQRTRQPNRKRR